MLVLNLLGVVLVYAASISIGWYTGEVRPALEVKYASEIIDASQRHGVEAALIAAVIQAESNFNPKARSNRGAMGLMQITTPTQRYLKLKNAYDPKQNVDAGAKYLSELLERFRGDLVRAIAAYNAGPGAVSKYAGVPPYSETRKYVKKVLSFLDFYRTTFGRKSFMS